MLVFDAQEFKPSFGIILLHVQGWFYGRYPVQCALTLKLPCRSNAKLKFLHCCVSCQGSLAIVRDRFSTRGCIISGSWPVLRPLTLNLTYKITLKISIDKCYLQIQGHKPDLRIKFWGNPNPSLNTLLNTPLALQAWWQHRYRQRNECSDSFQITMLNFHVHVCQRTRPNEAYQGSMAATWFVMALTIKFCIRHCRCLIMVR